MGCGLLTHPPLLQLGTAPSEVFTPQTRRTLPCPPCPVDSGGLAAEGAVNKRDSSWLNSRRSFRLKLFTHCYMGGWFRPASAPLWAVGSGSADIGTS